MATTPISPTVTAAPSPPPSPPPQVILMQMIFGKAVTQAVSVVARHRLADRMAAGPKTAEELATTAGLHAPHLARILRALAGLGILSGDETGRFGLTPVGEFLRSDVPGSLRAIATYVCDPWSWRPWGDLDGSVRTGAPVFDGMFGKGVFDYFNEHADEAATFNEGMTGFSQQAASAVVSAFDFSRFGTIMDVGGGHGALLGTILTAVPGSRGILFDMPAVVADAPSTAASMGIADRLTIQGGDFFSSVPSGADLIVMKNIIHDWNDAKATRILSNCRAAQSDGKHLLLVEMVVAPGYAPHFAHLLDLEMMVLCDGKERSHEEWAALLRGSGYRLDRVIPLEGSPLSLVQSTAV